MYLDAFCNDKKQLENLKNRYRSGTISDVELKKILTDILDELLSPIRKKRNEYENNDDYIKKCIEE